MLPAYAGPCLGSRWLDGLVERDPGFGGVHREARKALEPTSYPRLQDFLDALQSFEAYIPKNLARATSFFPKSLAYT